MMDSEQAPGWHVAHEHVLCRIEKTAGGCFRCPTQTVKDKTAQSDVITTAYANQLCDVMGCTGFKFNVCVLEHRCTDESSIRSLLFEKKRGWEHDNS